MQAREKDNRRDWIIVILIILIGLLCIMLAGGWALRLTPSWKLNSNMGSNLDPNSDFLTARSNGIIEPIDVSILTQPAWMGLYLTPGASFQTGTPFPTTVKNTLPPPATQTSVPTLTFNLTPTRTTTPPVIIYPTNTSAGNPQPTRTLIPPATPTASPIPVASADLSITITDGSTAYIVGGTITYTIVVRNTGPSAVTGATVTDTFPAVLSGITWTCTGSAGGTCPANGSGNINSTINLPLGGFVTYTVNATVSPAATGNLVNTASVTPPVTVSDPAPANNSATDTDTPIFNVDVQITKTDGITTYLPGTSTTYTIIVTNAGPANAIGAIVADTFPAAQVTGVTWSCVATGGATCTPNGIGNINETVNIPVGGTLTYTAIASISSAATGNLLNTATITVPAGYNETIPGNNSATDTDTPAPNADLSVTKTDNATVYTANATKIYSITVFNAGPSDVTGATLTDTFPAQIASATWSCAGVGGAVCTANGSGNINDPINVPVGSSVTYTVNATIAAAPTGDLANTASVSLPIGYTDSAPGNNTVTDTDTLIVTDPTPGEIGPAPDGNIYNLMSGGTLTQSINIVVNGHAGWDLVYYERPAGSGVLLDWMAIEISDGQNWYPIFNWGNNVADTNTNMDFNILPLPIMAPFPPPEEPDQRDIPSTSLYNLTGIAINLDGVVPPGTYSFIRFYAPPGDVDGQTEIDAIEVLP